MQSDLKEPLLSQEQKEPVTEPVKQSIHEHRKEKYWLGYFYQFLFVMCICCQQLLGKIMFTRHPTMNAAQLLFIRSLITCLLFLVLMNRKTTYYMYHSIPRDQIGNLINRTLQAVLFLISLYTTVKYFPLVFLALISATGPLLTAVFSYFMLKVVLSKFDIMVLLISFGGIVVLITGSTQEGTDQGAYEGVTLVWPLVLLFCIPFLTAYTAVILRKMRDLDEYTITSYSAFAICLIYGPIVYIFGFGLAFLGDFVIIDWIMLTILGTVSVGLQISRVKAVQYEEPARLAVVNYFQLIIQFGFDTILFNVAFNFQQILGIAIVFAITSVRWGIGIKKIFFTKRVKGQDRKQQGRDQSKENKASNKV